MNKGEASNTKPASRLPFGVLGRKDGAETPEARDQEKKDEDSEENEQEREDEKDEKPKKRKSWFTRFSETSSKRYLGAVTGFFGLDWPHS